MNAAARFRHFEFPGPVTAAFAADTVTPVRGLLGPQGGGKSSTVIYDALANASRMPICSDDVIRFKIAIIRDTYGRLQETTIPTWLHWIPKDDGEWDGGGGRQAHHKLRFETVRRVPLRWGREGSHVFPIDFEAVFAAIGDQAIEDFMRGFEVTAFWLNEMDLLSEEVLTLGIGRIGRYPAMEMLPPDTPLRGFPGYTLGRLPPGHSLKRVEGMQELPSGALYRDYMVGDYNAPDIDSWAFRRFEEDKPPGHKLYRQPGGRDPKAENLQNLKPGYYAQQVELNKHNPRWIRRYIDARYGPSADGEPVYPEYSDDRHLAPEPIKIARSVPIRVGLDAGIQRPAAAIEQWMPNGQWRMIDEVVPGRCGARAFARHVKKKLIEIVPAEWWHDGELIFTADPASFAGADKETGELSWAETVEHELSEDTEGLPRIHVTIEPAPSNELGLRLDAVRDQLTYMIDGDTPGFLISPVCRIARKGFAGSYKYRREQVGNTVRTSDRPLKDDFSHIQDGKQYNALGAKGRYGTIANVRTPAAAQASAAMKTTQLNTDFDVMSV